MRVHVKNNNIETALKIFKRKLKESNKLNVLRDKEYYDKPSSKRGRKKAAAELREVKRQGAENGNRRTRKTHTGSKPKGS